MKSEAEWNQEILRVILEIHQEFPELTASIQKFPLKAVENTSEEEYLLALKEYRNAITELL